jgi:NADH:ubiquinone oxidoreductase subunit 3 (subunit A)
MFHLHFKDYVFLIAVMLALMIVAGAFLLFNKGIISTAQVENAAPQKVANTGVFECGDSSFKLNASAESFDFFMSFFSGSTRMISFSP